MDKARKQQRAAFPHLNNPTVLSTQFSIVLDFIGWQMNKSYSLILYFFLTAFAANAQNSLSGVVTDKLTHELLPGAVINIPDLKTGTVTDANGLYKIDHIPGGRFLIEVKYVSYATLVLKVEISGATKLTIELTPSITELKGVIVTGVSSATDKKTSTIPVLSMDLRQLTEVSSTNLIDAVSKQPGMAAVSTGPAISKPTIRGLGYNRVVTLYNGMRQEGQQWGDEHGIELDEYSIDRVEIIKGPGSILYGSDALAGVINFLTPAHVAQGKIIGSLQSNYQTNNQFIGYSAMNAGNLKGFSWQARLSQKYAGNYQNKYDGIVYNSGFNETNYNGHLGLNRKWGYSRLYFSSFQQTIAMTEGERDSLGRFTRLVNEDSSITVTHADLKGYTIRTPYQQIHHQRLFLSNQFFIGKSRLAISAGYQLNQRKEFADPTDRNVYSLYFYLPTTTWDVKYFFPDNDKWKSSVGVSGMYQQNKNKGVEFLIPEYTLNDMGAFVFTQRAVHSRINLSGGIRYDRRFLQSNRLLLDSNGQQTFTGMQKFAAFNSTYQNVAASIGATCELTTKLIMRLNIARGFRAPNIAELASNGRHEGTYRYEYGNAKLNAETSWQQDLGLEWNSEHVHWVVSVFSNRVQQFIYAKKLRSVHGSDSIADAANPVPAYQYSQGTAWLYGGEFTLDIHPHPFDWLHLENSFSIVRARQLHQPDSSKYLPFIPAPRLLSEVRIDIKKTGSYVRNAFFKMNAEFYLRQGQILKENNTETPTPGYTLFNIGTGTDIVSKSGVKKCTFILSVNNVFDVAYQNHLSRLKYAGVNTFTARTGVYNMGRNISIKLVVPLIFK
jgi:iron complex outermembrane receptor protein